MSEDFTVRVIKRKKVAFARVLCVIMIPGILWFMTLDIMRPTLQESGAWWFFAGCVGVFALLFAWSVYAERRPRIEVRGDEAAFFPRWGRGFRLPLAEITGRTESLDFSDGGLGASAGGGMPSAGPALGGAPRGVIFTWFSGSRKLMSLSTQTMENADRFDALVRARLGEEAENGLQ